MRKVFLEDLPRKKGIGINKGKSVIDWVNSVGHEVKCIIDDIEIIVNITKYNKNKITIYNEVYNEYSIKTKNFSDCQLANYLNIKTDKFKYNIGYNAKNSKKDYTILEQEYIKNSKGFNDKFYICKCNNCGFDKIRIEEYRLNEEITCPCCGKSPRIIVLGINTIYDTDPWMMDFGISEEDAKKYTKSQGVFVYIKCPHCGKSLKRKISYIYGNRSISCSCGDKKSYISKYINSVLNQINLNVKNEARYDWCNYYNKYKNKNTYGLYDFAIEEMKLIIETDGEFHRKDNKMNGQTKEESEYIDDIKDKLAKENGYEVVRISNEGEIRENILNSKLNELFDLSKIDWNKCEEFALKNIVKEVCEYWNNKEEWEDVNCLAKHFNLSRTTIRRYLNKGNKLNWCIYNGTIEKNRLRNNKNVVKIKNN